RRPRGARGGPEVPGAGQVRHPRMGDPRRSPRGTGRTLRGDRHVDRLRGRAGLDRRRAAAAPEPDRSDRRGGGHPGQHPRGRPDPDHGGGGAQLGPRVVDLAPHVRAGVLRDRDDGGVRQPVRPRPDGGDSPGHPAAGGSHHRGGPGDDQDRADRAPAVGADGRAQVRHLDGVLRHLRRSVLLRQLLDPEGDRPGDSRRRVRAGVPPPSGGADRRHPEAPGADQARADLETAGGRGAARGVGDGVALRTEELMLNMGPQHPSTHGVLRLIVTLDGENIVDVQPDIGYLHSSVEKMMENRTYLQNIALVDRGMDYLSTMANEEVWVLACERLGNIEVPARARYIRTIMLELQRISSHLIWLGTFGIDLGAFTAFLWAMRERERIMDLFESATGGRLHHVYFRLGGVFDDLPEGWTDRCAEFCDYFLDRLPEYDELLTGNPIFLA